MSEKKTRRHNGEGSKPIQRKDGRWQINIRTSQTTTGAAIRKTFIGKTRANVVSQVNKWRAELQAGFIEDPTKLTLGGFARYWLEEIAPARVRPSTLETYELEVNKWIIRHRHSRTLLTQITTVHFEQIVNGPRHAGLSESTVRKIHILLAKILKDAHNRGLIGTNPASRLQAPKPAHFEATVLTPAQTQNLIQRAREDEVYGVKNILALALGVRQGEILGWCWDDVDFQRKLIRVRRTRKREPGGGFTMRTTKTKAGTRVYPLPDELVELLMVQKRNQERWQAEAGFRWKKTICNEGKEWQPIFTYREGGIIHPQADRYQWKRFTQANGIEGMRVHDTRHTAATTMLALGIAPRVVQSLMGWSDGAMLQRYQHVLDEMQQDAAGRVASALFSEVEQVPVSGDSVNVTSGVVNFQAWKERKSS